MTRDTEQPIVMSSDVRKKLFCLDDELEFKRSFAIKFLASIEAVNYLDNCHRGWSGHKLLVEDAHFLAEKAWDEWQEVIGCFSTEGKL